MKVVQPKEFSFHDLKTGDLVLITGLASGYNSMSTAGMETITLLVTCVYSYGRPPNGSCRADFLCLTNNNVCLDMPSLDETLWRNGIGAFKQGKVVRDGKEMLEFNQESLPDDPDFAW